MGGWEHHSQDVQIPYCSTCLPHAEASHARREQAGCLAMLVAALVGGVLWWQVTVHIDDFVKPYITSNEFWGFVIWFGVPALAGFIAYLIARAHGYKLILRIPWSKLPWTDRCTLPAIVEWDRHTGTRIAVFNQRVAEAILRENPHDAASTMHQVTVVPVRTGRGDLDIASYGS